MQFRFAEDRQLPVKIKVVGIGGAGGNAGAIPSFAFSSPELGGADCLQRNPYSNQDTEGPRSLSEDSSVQSLQGLLSQQLAEIMRTAAHDEWENQGERMQGLAKESQIHSGLLFLFVFRQLSSNRFQGQLNPHLDMQFRGAHHEPGLLRESNCGNPGTPNPCGLSGISSKKG
jgi:hypothetical protein